jgi:hypothetical protein
MRHRRGTSGHGRESLVALLPRTASLRGQAEDRSLAVVEGVRPRSSIAIIGTDAAVEAVVAVVAEQGVVTGLAQQAIVPFVAKEDVVARTASQVVVAGATSEGVVAGAIRRMR